MSKRCEWLFASDVKGDVEVVRGTGALFKEWKTTFYDILQKCGDTDQVPKTAEERWVRAHPDPTDQLFKRTN